MSEEGMWVNSGSGSLRMYVLHVFFLPPTAVMAGAGAAILDHEVDEDHKRKKKPGYRPYKPLISPGLHELQFCLNHYYFDLCFNI